MLQYSIIDHRTIMKGQQKECSEIHTIQIFREASSCMTSGISNQDFRQSPEIIPRSTLIPGQQNELPYGIGGDWAIEMDDDVMDIEQPSTALDTSQHSQEGESSLYSFYFEAPIVSMGQDSSSDDYTITSHDTESFCNENDLNLDHIENIWEQGLRQTSSSNVKILTSQSNPSIFRDASTKE